MPEFNKKRRILLVDDNEVNLKILEKILKDDYLIMTANNGKQALKILHSYAISLVVLDIIMPIMNGYEVLEIMRSEEALKKIPVIVASGAQENEGVNVEEKALTLGANDYVTKPYMPNVLKRRIENVMYVNDTSDFFTLVKYDELTGLYNKEYFYIKVVEIIKQNPSRQYDLVCCDIERFKLINDLYGTQTGDDVLKSCANLFYSRISNYGICGRIGADIFAFLIIHQDRDYNKIIRLTIDEINKLNIGMNVELKYGFYPISDIDEPVSLMCDRAKLALNSIKGKYGVLYQFYNDDIRNKLIEEQYLITHMKKAIEEHQFEVYFQPKYEIKSSTIVGAEALVRWNDPQKGFLSPGLFIPLFEKNGFITELDKYVWEESLMFLRSLIKSGKPAIPISLNMSRADLYNIDIDKYMLKLVQKYMIKPSLIHLEVTETAYTEDPKQLVQMLNRLKAMGFKIDMDDFGSGYSSLNMLSDLPIDVLKLDMGFMNNKKQESNRNVLSFIISLAKWMNLDVVAEGAETKEQIDLLKALGCNIVQGFYFSKPLKQIDFENKLTQQQINQKRKLNDSKNINSIPLSSIVLISDNQENETTFKDIFDNTYCVHKIDYTANTDDMLEKYNQSIELVILDYKETLSDESIKQITSQCKDYNIPIIIALPNKDHVEKAIELGFTDFLTKPFMKISTLNRAQVIIQNAKCSEDALNREIEEAIFDMKNRAEQDSLTGLLNRAEFETQVTAQLQNNDPKKSYFVMLDIDNFKRINDVLGHNVGDSALKSLANYLNKIFNNNDIIGRMGGDEFAVYVPFCETTNELQNRVDQICHSFVLNVENITITCSAGICAVCSVNNDFTTVYESADMALLAAKRNGKSRYKYYKKGMDVPVNTALERNAMLLLDGISDATFVCDAVTSDIIYVNDTACKLINKTKRECLGLKCYEVFWQRSHNCDRCNDIGKCTTCFYEEDTMLVDGKTPVHIKAKTDNWGGKLVKIHYLQLINK